MPIFNGCRIECLTIIYQIIVRLLWLQEFFEKRGAASMGVRDLFDFVTDPTINDDMVDEYIAKVPLPVLVGIHSSGSSVFEEHFVASLAKNLRYIEFGKP